VWVLAKARDWDKAPAEAQAAFRVAERRHGMVTAVLAE
jgi:hypothetical protein